MNDLIEKLRAILTELGVEPEKIEAALAALSEEETPVPPEVNGEEPISPSEEPVQEEPVAADVPPIVEEEPVEVPVEETPIDPASVPQEEVPPVDVPPVEEPVPPVQEGAPVPPMPELPPMVSIEEFNAVKTDLEETKKALEGMKAAYDSMKEALTAAGVIDGASATEVGIDNPSAPGHSNVSTVLDDVLAEINRKGY